MVNTKYNKMFIRILCSSFVFILISYTVVFLFNDSYTVYAESPDFPSSTFTASYTGENNLVANALGSDNRTSNYSVKTNYRANNNRNIAYSMMKNLVQPSTSEQFEILNDNPTTITDQGILYILSHGYNQTNTTNTVFTAKKYGAVTDTAKEYITQIALWLYIYENKGKFGQYCVETGETYSSCDFHNNGVSMPSSDVRGDISNAAKKSGYNFLNYILLLVDNANKYAGNSSSSMNEISITGENYKVSEDGTSLLTNEITPTPKSNSENYMHYSVSIDDPNNYGAYLVDTNNQKITDLSNLSGTFKVYVPLQDNLDNMDLSSITIHITAKFINLEKEFTYRVTKTSAGDGKIVNKKKKQKFSDLLLVYIPTKTVEQSFSLENIVKISKIDATSKEGLPGATLVIKNKKDGFVVVSMVSTKNPKYLYLKKGDYTLCETNAPDGYSLNKECIDFTVDEKKIVSVTMKNNKVIETSVPVPNTRFNISHLIYIIGGIILIAGVCLIGITIVAKKKKKNS